MATLGILISIFLILLSFLPLVKAQGPPGGGDGPPFGKGDGRRFGKGFRKGRFGPGGVSSVRSFHYIANVWSG